MTAYLAGIAQTRCMEHPAREQIDGPMRAVLSAMAWPTRESDPCCTAANATTAERCGFDRRTVRRAVKRLAELGLIERVQGRPGKPVGWRMGKPVEWRLTILQGAREGGTESPTPTEDLGHRVPPPGTERPTPWDSLSHNPSDLSRPQGREKRGRSDAATRLASADAPAAAAAPSTEQSGSGIVAEVMAARGSTRAAAESWIERKLNGASDPVWSETNFLRECLTREAADAASSAKAGKAGKRAAPAKKTASQAAPATPARKRATPATMEQRYEEIDRMRAGTPFSEVAERWGVTVQTPKSWFRQAEQSAAHFLKYGRSGSRDEIALKLATRLPASEVSHLLALIPEPEPTPSDERNPAA